MRPIRYGYLALALCFSSVAGCSSCKKGKGGADAAAEAAASVAMPMDSASAMPSASAADAPSSEPAEATSAATTKGHAAMPGGLPSKCKDTKSGTSGLGVLTLTPTGGGGVAIHAKAANATCSPQDEKHLHCKWTMLPGTKDSNIKNFSVTKGWTLTIKESKEPNRYFYGSSYYGGELDCHETP